MRICTPACFRLTSAVEYRASSMNHMPMSIAVGSALMRFIKRSRQFSNDESQNWSFASERAGVKHRRANTAANSATADLVRLVAAEAFIRTIAISQELQNGRAS